jgi:uncharacterized protein YqcC (DUF446 family)
MTCVVCGVRSSREDASAELRELGWFVWRKEAPIAHHGCAVCPKCVDTVKRVREAMEWDAWNPAGA